ncbi:MAG: type II toxin-antitoxin system RelE/ParE family toxin [Terriglobia bacterium]
MSAKPILAPEAEQDIADAYDWYEARRPGLGEDFLSCVDACIQGICRNPEMYAVVHQAYRRALLRRFPYAVFYEHTGDLVTVYSVFHTSQDPTKWRQRLP